MNGIIFDIKEFSIHDGPGPRITVFLKGCPLRCLWCHNPEGLPIEPQLMFKEIRCHNCGACFKPCDHEECQPFERCVKRCPYDALSICGEKISADKLVAELLTYSDLVNSMGGGFTFSGGEPLMQAKFLLEVLNKLDQSVHTAIQTSGYASEEVFRDVISKIDYVMLDIKFVDPELHKKYTGVTNQQIIENLSWLKKSSIPFLLRTPLIPGITDTVENLTEIAALAEDAPVELLSYNTFAPAKYPMLGMEYSLQDLEDSKEPDLSIFKNVRLSKL